MEIQEYKENREMEQEILLEDGIGYEHKVKYLDENTVTVQSLKRYVQAPGHEQYVQYGMPAKVRIHQINSWPFTEHLKEQILSFHAQFPDAK